MYTHVYTHNDSLYFIIRMTSACASRTLSRDHFFREPETQAEEDALVDIYLSLNRRVNCSFTSMLQSYTYMYIHITRSSSPSAQ